MTRRLHAELLDPAGAVLGEGPVWDARTDELSWVDILSGLVHVCDGDGKQRATYDAGGHVGAALPAEDGGWLLTTTDGFARLHGDGSVRPLLAVQDDPEMRFNDAKCDPWGQALAGTMRYDETPGSAALYRLEAAAAAAPGDGPAYTARVLLEDVGLSNGLGWSEDGRTVHFIDSLSRTVARHRYAPDAGGLGAGQTLVVVDAADGVPDGLCVDVRGYIWVALYGGGAVHCYRPDGLLDAVVDVPVAHPTSVAFGGPAGDRLFITTARGDGSGATGGAGRGTTGAAAGAGGAGGLWMVEPGTEGPPATLWRDPWRPRPSDRRPPKDGLHG